MPRGANRQNSSLQGQQRVKVEPSRKVTLGTAKGGEGAVKKMLSLEEKIQSSPGVCFSELSPECKQQGQKDDDKCSWTVTGHRGEHK